VRAIPRAPGAVAGALGTLALSAFEPVRDVLLGRPPVYAVRALATRGARRTWGVRLSSRSAQGWGLLARWLYGPMLGAVYAAWRSRLPAPARLGGLTLGVAVGLLERGALPWLGVTPPWRSWPPREKTLLGVQVLLFGIVTEAVLSRRATRSRSGPRRMGPASSL